MGTQACFENAVNNLNAIAAYRFNNMSGATGGSDESGNGHSLSFSSPLTKSSTIGRVCNELGIGGSSHATIDELGYDFSNGISIEFFLIVKYITSKSSMISLSNGTDTDVIEIGLPLSGDNILLTCGSATLETSGGELGSTVGNLGRHVVVTISSAGFARIYFNGSLAASGTVDTPAASPSRTTNYISKSNITGGVGMNINAIFCAIYDYELSAAQVSQNYGLLHPEELDGRLFSFTRVACTGSAKSHARDKYIVDASINGKSVGSNWSASTVFVNKSVSGTVMESGVPVSREVRVFSGITPDLLLGQSVSDPITGEFTVDINEYSGEVTVIAYDNADAPDMNAQIKTKVLGV
jgi:hypothetical protein